MAHLLHLLSKFSEAIKFIAKLNEPLTNKQ